jgi:hypothetical protein
MKKKKNENLVVKLLDKAGTFAEDKDLARELRLGIIVPALRVGKDVTLDFSGVESTTQSFVHALISELIREFGIDVLDRITFKGCGDTVKKIISIVTEYMQHEEDPTILLKSDPAYAGDDES